MYPDGVENQAVGSLVQGASRALSEEVAFNSSQVTSLDWVTYPIMRFKDSPKITFEFIQRTDIPAEAPGRAGERDVAAGRHRRRSGSSSAARASRRLDGVGAAIANAFFDATGVRIRSAPLTPARVRNYLRAAGI